MADRHKNEMLEWSSGARAKRDIPPHTIVLIEAPAACAPHVVVPEGAPGMFAFPGNATFPLSTATQSRPYVPIAQLVESLRLGGWTDETVSDDFALLKTTVAPTNATPLIRAALCNSFEMRCPFTSVIIGEAVYIRASTIKHSCRPNAFYTFGTGGAIYVATGDNGVQEGEEITISRIGTCYGSTRCTCNRRAMLLCKLGYVCMCEMCKEADAGDVSSADGARCPDDKCHGSLRKTADKDVFASAMKPFSGMCNNSKEFVDISKLWRAHREEVIETPTFLDILSRKSALHAVRVQPEDVGHLSSLDEMAQTLEATIPHTSAVLPEFLRYVVAIYKPQYEPHSAALWKGHMATLEWIRAMLKRFPWISEDEMRNFSYGSTAINPGLPIIIQASWSKRGVDKHTFLTKMDAEMKFDINDLTRIAELTDTMLLTVAHTIGIDPMKHRFAVEGEDRDAFVAVISERIAEVKGNPVEKESI